MKAIVYTKYGPPEVLQLKDVEKPTPKENEALVRIHAASLNAPDLDYLRGRFFARFQGLFKPKYKILGSDIAGKVEEVGRNVKKFQPGDDIFVNSFNCGFGAFAEYVCVPENELTLKPANMTFEEAATLPSAALIALQGLRDKRQIQPGQKVLINGAGGGTGIFAVQIAKSFGAEVTGVDSAEKLDMVRSIGADHVIDYKQEDFTKNGQHYDYILDVIMHRSIFDYKRALSQGGICVIVGGSLGRILKTMLLAPLLSMFGSKKVCIVGWKINKKEDLVFIEELIEAGKVVPVIDKRYPLSEVAEALRYLEEEPFLGKVVITMENNNKT